MEIIMPSGRRQKGRAVRDWKGVDIVQVFGVPRRRYRLAKDFSEVTVTSQDRDVSALRIVIAVLLALTLIGLILAIPLLARSRRPQVTLVLKTHDGDVLRVHTRDRKDWAVLSRYVTGTLPTGPM